MTLQYDPSSGRAANAAGLPRPLALARWLEIVAAMVVLIIMVGGITRLTESGLSITQWQPVTGVLPPLNEAAWQEEFAKYQATPEYRFEAGPAGMTLSDFKSIFFWEWFHRLLGRFIGMAFALPMIWFWAKKAIPSGYKPRLIALMALGGAQGVFGWLMVRSGLSGEMTDVSHFWLSIHLLTAFLTLGALIWTALDLRNLANDKNASPARISPLSLAVAAILFVQLLLGAWVAGLNAGHAAYDWPLMNGRLIPEIDFANGFWVTITHDPFILHFAHRWWAWIAAGALIVLARKIRSRNRPASIAIHSAFGTMIILGIATVMSEVSLWVAISHQLVGALLVIASSWGMHSHGISAQSAKQ